MKLKMDDAGHVVVSDGKPVYVSDDGKEIVFDYATTLLTISRLNGEAKAHRTTKEAAETKLAGFEGIDDPEAAKKALQTVANLDAKKLVDAGQVETVKQEAITAVEAKYKPVVEERDALKGQVDELMIGGSFTGSKYVTDKIAIPGDMLRARFGKNFEVKDGKIVAKDASGNQIFSRARPGEPADFEEAIEHLVDTNPQKDHILKGTCARGDGKQPNAGGGGSDKKTMSRAAFDALSPAEKASTAGKVQIVDAA